MKQKKLWFWILGPFVVIMTSFLLWSAMEKGQRVGLELNEIFEFWEGAHLFVKTENDLSAFADLDLTGSHPASPPLRGRDLSDSLKKRWDKYKNLPAEEHRHWETLYQKYQELPAVQRDRIRQNIEKARSLVTSEG